MSGVHPRLLLTDSPKPDESLTGYLMRLSALNSYESPRQLLALADIGGDSNWQQVPFAFRRCADLERLRELTGITLPELANLLYPPAEGRFAGDHLFFGSPIPRTAIQPRAPKVCPACLEESAHCRRIWDFKLVTCCPIHRRLLADECPSCGQRIGGSRPAPCMCPCGFDLRSFCTRPVADAASRLSCFFYHLCGVDSGIKEGSIDAQNPLAPLSLEHAATAVLFISSRLLTGGQITGTGLGSLYNREVHELLVRTGSIFERWPERFFKFVDAKREQVRAANKSKFARQFGTLYGYLFERGRLLRAELNFFRDAFARYLELQQFGSHLIRRVKINPKYITKREAGARLGMTELWVYRFALQGKLNMATREGCQSRILIEADSVEKLKNELSQLLDLRGTAKCLGVPLLVAHRLIRAGCLTPRRGKEIDGCPKLYFARADVEGLLKNITSRLPLHDPLSKNCPDLRLAVKRFGPMDDNLPNKIKAILAGRLFPRKKPIKKRRAPTLESPALPF